MVDVTYQDGAAYHALRRGRQGSAPAELISRREAPRTRLLDGYLQRQRAILSFYFVQFVTGLASACSLFLVASGLSIIFGVTRVVNFAHGAFYMLGAYIGYTLIDRLSGAVGFWGAIVLAALAVAAIGTLVEMALLRRIYDAPELFQLLATFGVTLVVEDLALLIWGPSDLLGPRAPGFKGAIDLFGQPFPTYDLLLIVARSAGSRVHMAALPPHDVGRSGACGDSGPRDGLRARRQPEMAIHQRLRARRFSRRPWRGA